MTRFPIKQDCRRVITSEGTNGRAPETHVGLPGAALLLQQSINRIDSQDMVAALLAL